MRAVGLVLALGSAISATGQEQPEYSDQPKFIVAGVADPSQRGGHGADPVLRSSEALTKATALLRAGVPAAGNIEALREAVSREPDRAGPHHSLADAEERLGHALEAVREYQRAAELDPTEANLFDWGAELLTHRAAEQAVEVFSNANRRFPRSTRVLLGLAVALYSRGAYDQAAPRFFDAADLNPGDPEPYLFLGRVSSGAITASTGFSERMERFARLQPGNAWASYYYAMSLLSRRQELAKVEPLFEKAVRLDPRFGLAHLQLGILLAERGDLPKAIAAYRSAIEANPEMEEAHYRLAQAYRKTGEPGKADAEIALYQQLSKRAAEESERDRSEVQQFVFELKRQ